MTSANAVLHLDPQDLIANSPTNVRIDLGDLAPLVESIRALGVIQPVTVTPQGDHYRIIAGQRRCHAAVQAELATVPAVARTDINEQDELAAQMVENLQRKDLTVGEKAKGFEQLSAFGLDAKAIAKRTGTKAAEVRQQLTVAASDVAVTVASRYDLTLEHALALCEFEDDKDAIKTLTVTAHKEPDQFDHTLARLRRDRETRIARQAILDDLAAKDIPVITAPRYNERTTARRLSDLTDPKGRGLTPSKHARCPGHAASVTDNGWEKLAATYWCTDAKAHGHLDKYASHGGAARQGAMTDEEKAERRTVIENNKAWVAATDVRLAYLRNLFAQRTPPKGTLRWATTEILTNPSSLGQAQEAVLADLLGDKTERPAYGHHVGPAAVENSADARLPILLAAQAAARLESGMGKHTWRHRHPAEAAYLTWLASTGYTLSDVEQLVIDTASSQALTHSAQGIENHDVVADDAINGDQDGHADEVPDATPHEDLATTEL